MFNAERDGEYCCVTTLLSSAPELVPWVDSVLRGDWSDRSPYFPCSSITPDFPSSSAFIYFTEKW